jgi:polar amino acid transport system substrate-binding protein
MIMKSLSKLLRLSLIGAVLGFGIQQASAQDAGQALSQASVIEKIEERGSLRAGLSTFVPWAFPDKNGKLVGFEVDVINKLAEDLGVKAEPVLTNWDGIIPALVAGKIDLIIGGMTITPKRNLTINFTDPYENSEVYAIVNKKVAASIKTLDDLNQPGIIFANRRGATTEAIAKQLFPKATQNLFDEENASLQEVLNGRAQVALASTPTPALWVEKYPDTLSIPLDQPLASQPTGIGLRKGDPDGLNFLNNWIAVRTADGWLAERFNYWFKGHEWRDLEVKTN